MTEPTLFQALTPDQQRIAELEAQLAALRPQTEPHLRFFNGSLVLYNGVLHQVVSRSVDATYHLAPVVDVTIHVHDLDTHQIVAHTHTQEDLRTLETRVSPSQVLLPRTPAMLVDERLWDVPEADLTPWRPSEELASSWSGVRTTAASVDAGAMLDRGAVQTGE